MNNIEQDIDGEVFGIAYQDCGKFFVTIFSPEGKEIDNVKVSTELNIDADSTPVSGFYEPLTTCCFLQDSKVLIAVYHRFNKQQYHFVYSYKEKKIMTKTIMTELKDCTDSNFPIKSFYSEVTGNCHVFYRQGHGFTINALNPSETRVEKITKDGADLGNMYLLYGEALVTRSSGSILFFKIDEETGEWTRYHSLPNMRGSIYFIRGNIRIQIVTDEYVHFFIINKKTLEP